MKQKQMKILEEEESMQKSVGILFLGMVSALVGIVGSFIPGIAGQVIKWGFFLVFAGCVIYLITKRKLR